MQGEGVGRGRGADDGVPDQGFGDLARSGGGGRGLEEWVLGVGGGAGEILGLGEGVGLVGGVEIQEGLLGVPVEERGQVGREVEAEVGVFVLGRGAVAGLAADSVGEGHSSATGLVLSALGTGEPEPIDIGDGD